jgi:hypothetical protein
MTLSGGTRARVTGMVAREQSARRVVGAAAAAVCLVALLAAGGVVPGVGLRRSPAPPAVKGATAAATRPLLVYGRHALTPAQVKAATTATGSLISVYGQELAVRSARPGYPVVPVVAITVDPAGFAAAMGVPALAGLLAKGVVLSTRGAALRKLGAGQDVVLASGRHLRVAAIVDDHWIGGYELAAAPSTLPAQGSDASYLLVGQGPDPGATTARIRRSLPGVDLRVESNTRNGYLSSADTVLTQAQVKTAFGEFAVRTTAFGSLRVDPTWRSRWISSTVVPQLGIITCNRAVIPALRAAMTEVTRRGLGKLVHTADFRREGGCWSPRLKRFGAGQVSSHAWGIAVDINVDDNPLGAKPVQDPRLVAIMAAHGFYWGGLFLRPDGAHFEWVGNRS